MKGRLQLGLIMGLTLMTLTSSIATRSVLAQSAPNIQNLPDGEYFYGDAPSPNETGAGYMVFRKTGSSIVGLFYQQGENLQFCFTGREQLSTTKVVSEAKPVPSSSVAESSLSQSLGLGRLYKLRFDQLPDALAKNYQQCVQ